MNLEPRANNVVLSAPEKPKETTQSGIVIPESADKEKATVVSTVLAIGPFIKSFKVGDRVVWNEYGLDKFQLDGQEVYIGSGEHVIAVVQ